MIAPFSTKLITKPSKITGSAVSANVVKIRAAVGCNRISCDSQACQRGVTKATFRDSYWRLQRWLQDSSRRFQMHCGACRTRHAMTTAGPSHATSRQEPPPKILSAGTPERPPCMEPQRWRRHCYQADMGWRKITTTTIGDPPVKIVQV